MPWLGSAGAHCALVSLEHAYGVKHGAAPPAEYCPEAHGMQSPVAVLAPALAYLPASHAVSWHWRPPPAEYWPAGQSAQPSEAEVAPVLLDAAPGLHWLLEHCATPPPEYWPAPQLEH